MYIAALTTRHRSPYPESYETIVHNLCEFVTKMNSSLREEANLMYIGPCIIVKVGE